MWGLAATDVAHTWKDTATGDSAYETAAETQPIFNDDVDSIMWR